MMRAAWVMAMLRHLPPSASALHVVDVGGACGDVLTSQRSDLVVQTASLVLRDWPFAVSSADAVTLFDTSLTPELLAACLSVLRPGGRLVAVQPEGHVDPAYGQTLTDAGYIRLLVEEAVNGQGVLIRGEKPHTTADTLARVQVAAAQDADALTLDTFKGRFLYLLIRQTPNKPPWAVTPQDVVVWEAVTLPDHTFLAFTSLPKAVAFLQTAVLQNALVGISKVAKFRRDVPLFEHYALRLNPSVEAVRGQTHFVAIDPLLAEASDE